ALLTPLARRRPTDGTPRRWVVVLGRRREGGAGRESRAEGSRDTGDTNPARHRMSRFGHDVVANASVVAGGSEETGTLGVDGDLDTVPDPELGLDGGEVRLDRGGRDEELRGDLGV